jgi:hypothetical protein
MAGTDYRNGANFQSRGAEFSGALSGNGGANYVVKQSPPPVMNSYQPSSVLSPIGPSGNGMSGSTYASNRALRNY